VDIIERRETGGIMIDDGKFHETIAEEAAAVTDW